MQASNRLIDRFMNRRRIKDSVHPGGCIPGALLRPPIARRNKTQVEKPAIRHGARGGADILRELGTDEDDDRAVLRRRADGVAAVTPCHARFQTVPWAESSNMMPIS